MIRFHLDESVRTAIAVGLRSHGVDVTTTVEAGLLGATDEMQISYGIREDRTIVTHDDDFLVLASSGGDHPGVCYCHQQKHSVGKLLQVLLVVNECCTQEDMRCHVEFL
jgi:predicted nuclease of predicted toxin-antitoxin system